MAYLVMLGYDDISCKIYIILHSYNIWVRVLFNDLSWCDFVTLIDIPKLLNTK